MYGFKEIGAYIERLKRPTYATASQVSPCFECSFHRRCAWIYYPTAGLVRGHEQSRFNIKALSTTPSARAFSYQNLYIANKIDSFARHPFPTKSSGNFNLLVRCVYLAVIEHVFLLTMKSESVPVA